MVFILYGTVFMTGEDLKSQASDRSGRRSLSQMCNLKSLHVSLTKDKKMIMSHTELGDVQLYWWMYWWEIITHKV